MNQKQYIELARRVIESTPTATKKLTNGFLAPHLEVELPNNQAQWKIPPAGQIVGGLSDATTPKTR